VDSRQECGVERHYGIRVYPVFFKFGGVLGNEPFGSRSEPDIRVSASNLCQPSGEIPKGRAELFLSLCVYAPQRTLEPELEPGVTEKGRA
jgi:hypothetical protein